LILDNQNKKGHKHKSAMRIFAFTASFSAIALPLAVAGHQDFSAPALEALGRRTLTAALSEAKAGVIAKDSSRDLRQLEFTEACNNTYNALWDDADLNAAYLTYETNLDAVLADAVSDDDLCTTKGNDVSCKVDGAVAGDTEFQNACTTAGGKVDSFEFDVACTLTLDGTDASIFVDMPDTFDCYPPGAEFADCAESLLDIIGDLFQLLEEELESTIRMSGFTNVNCDAGAGVTNNPGSAATPRSLWTVVVATAAATIGAFVIA
jgi:hypothetical protein